MRPQFGAGTGGLNARAEVFAGGPVRDAARLSQLIHLLLAQLIEAGFVVVTFNLCGEFDRRASADLACGRFCGNDG